MILCFKNCSWLTNDLREVTVKSDENQLDGVFFQMYDFKVMRCLPLELPI